MSGYISTLKNSPASALAAEVGEKFVPGKPGPDGSPWVPMQYSEPEITEIIERYGVNYRFIYGENPAPHQSGYWYIGDDKNLVYEYGVGYRVYDKNQPSFFSSLISNFAPIGAILAAALAVGMYVGSGSVATTGADFLGSGITQSGGGTGISAGAGGVGITVPSGGGVASGLIFDGLAPVSTIAGGVGGVGGATSVGTSLGGLLSGAGQIAGVVGAVAGAAGSVAAAQNQMAGSHQQPAASAMPLILLGGAALAIFALARG